MLDTRWLRVLSGTTPLCSINLADADTVHEDETVHLVGSCWNWFRVSLAVDPVAVKAAVLHYVDLRRRGAHEPLISQPTAWMAELLSMWNYVIPFMNQYLFDARFLVLWGFK